LKPQASVAPLSLHTASSTTAVQSTAHTTSSSKAVVIPGKPVTKKQVKTKVKAKDINNDSLYGFLDEDKAVEREVALSSPIKGRQRLSSMVSNVLMLRNSVLLKEHQAIVKIKPTLPLPEWTSK
jgi:hypothetical protein